MQKDADAYRTISEVAQDLGLPSHVLRFWETKFPQIKPLKRGGGRRYYRPQDADLLRGIRGLLHDDGYTIRGVQRLLKDQGPAAIVLLAQASPRGRRCDEREADRPAGDELVVAAGHEIEKPAPDPAPPDGEPRVQTYALALRSLLEEIELCREALAAASLE